MLWNDQGGPNIKVPVFLVLVVVGVDVRVALVGLGILAPGIRRIDVVPQSLMAPALYPALELGLLTVPLSPSLALPLALALILDHLPMPPCPPPFPRRSVRFGYELGWKGVRRQQNYLTGWPGFVFTWQSGRCETALVLVWVGGIQVHIDSLQRIQQVRTDVVFMKVQVPIGSESQVLGFVSSCAKVGVHAQSNQGS